MRKVCKQKLAASFEKYAGKTALNKYIHDMMQLRLKRNKIQQNII